MSTGAQSVSSTSFACAQTEVSQVSPPTLSRGRLWQDMPPLLPTTTVASLFSLASSNIMQNYGLSLSLPPLYPTSSLTQSYCIENTLQKAQSAGSSVLGKKRKKEADQDISVTKIMLIEQSLGHLNRMMMSMQKQLKLERDARKKLSPNEKSLVEIEQNKEMRAYVEVSLKLDDILYKRVDLACLESGSR